ncbi:MAG: hypothetical protein KIS86_11415 [Devosia sp.]|nr:hypothetical protein [Devosia sp.]
MYDQEIDLRAIVGVLHRQLHLLAVFCCMGVGIALVYSLVTRPQFSATALLFVDTTPMELLQPEQMHAVSSSAENARVESEAEIVRSIPTLLRLIENEDLLDNAYFAPRASLWQQVLAFIGFGEPELATGDEALSALIARLQRATAVQRRAQTYIVAVEAAASEPPVAARLANAMVKAHIDLQREAKARRIVSALDTLEPHMAEAAAGLTRSESELDAFIDANIELMAAQSGDPTLLDNRRELKDALATARRLEDTLAQARSRLAEKDYKQLAAVLNSVQLREVESARSRVLASIALTPSRGAIAPALDAELAALQDRLEATARNEITSLQTALAANQLRIQGVREAMRKLLADSTLSPQIWTRIYELQQGTALARANYERFLARVSQLRSQIDLQQADSHLVAEAIVPMEPSSPSPILVVAFAGCLGLGVGLGVALLVDTYTGGFTSQEQLEAITGREVATGIPLIKPVRHAGGDPALSYADAVVLSPLSNYAESLRRLRLRLDLRLPMAAGPSGGLVQGRVIVVGSAVSFEGKTTTALGLARTYGLEGQRVLIIDADLRRPALFRHLDAGPVAGLLDYLSGALPPEALVTAVGIDPLSGISTIVNARPGDGPTERFLTNAAFHRLIGAARKSFDVIIIDTPPLAGIVDGVYAMKFADAVIMLTRYANTRQRDVLRALAVLERARPDMPPVLMAMTQQPDSAHAYGERYDAHYVMVQ